MDTTALHKCTTVKWAMLDTRRISLKCDLGYGWAPIEAINYSFALIVLLALAMSNGEAPSTSLLLLVRMAPRPAVRLSEQNHSTNVDYLRVDGEAR